MSYEFSHWGERVRTDALPIAYVPEQLAARLPETFLLLLAMAAAFGVIGALQLGRSFADKTALPLSVEASRRLRGLLVVLAAAVMPIVLIMIQRTTIYDGIRHLLFVIPMLAVIASAAFVVTLPALRRFSLVLPVLLGAYAGATALTLARLHPLEYVAMKSSPAAQQEPMGGSSLTIRQWQPGKRSVSWNIGSTRRHRGPHCFASWFASPGAKGRLRRC